MLLRYNKLGGLKFALWGITGFASLFLLLPVVFIAALSFGSSQWLVFPPPSWTLRWYQEVWNDPRWVDSLLASLKVACIVTALSVSLALPASFALVRGDFPLRKTLRGFFMTPMVMPVVVFAVALYALFLKIGLSGTLLGFVIAHTVLAFPFAVVAITNSLEGFDSSVESAAVICGATPLQAKIKVTLPAIRLGLLSAALFSFLMSWDEVVVAIFMASPTLQTLPVRVWGALRQDLSPVIAAISTLLVLVTVIAMLAGALLRGRSVK